MIEDEELPQVIVCQGPPHCDKEGDEAVEAAKAGCVWCERHSLLPGGEWHVEKPALA